MSRQFDEDDRLGDLLRLLPAPEPSAQLASSARRRYLEAIEARARREAVIGLAAALVGLAMIAVLIATVFEPVTLVAWLAEAAADFARWTTGIVIVLALVPSLVWGSLVLGSAATMFVLAFAARGRLTVIAKQPAGLC
jgi:hypothetical protein